MKNRSTAPGETTSYHLGGGRVAKRHRERDLICNKLRAIFSEEPGVREWWAPQKVNSIRKVNFNSNMDAWAFEEIQGPKVQPKAAVANVGSTKGRGPPLQKDISGDQDAAHPCNLERFSHSNCRVGHRRRSGQSRSSRARVRNPQILCTQEN